MSETGKDNSRCLGKYKIKTPEELQERIDSYFKACDTNRTDKLLGDGANAIVSEVPDPIPYTLTDLALHIGLRGGRQSILNYQERDGFDEIIEEAKLKILSQWERRLARVGNNSGAQFYVTNNAKGYIDQKNVNVGGQPGNPIEVKVETNLSEEQLAQIEAIYNSGKET